MNTHGDTDYNESLHSSDISVHMSHSRCCPDLRISLVCPDVQSPMSICPL